MPNVKSSATAQFTTFHTAFPRTQYPAFVYTDKLYETHPYNWGQNGSDGQASFLTLPESECVIPAPVRVWHNNMINGQQPNLGDTSYPGIVWYPETDNNTTLFTSYSPPQYYTELMAQNSPINPSSGSAVPSQNCIDYIADLTANWTTSDFVWSSTPINCVGFAFQVKQTPFAQTGSAGNSQTNLNTSEQPSFSLNWCVSDAGTEEASSSGGQGTSENDMVYGLIVDGTNAMQFGYYDSLGDFHIIKKIDYAGSFDAGVKGSYSTGQEYQLFDVMLIGGKMYVGLGGEIVKLTTPDARYDTHGQPISTIIWAEFTSWWTQTCSFSIHPTKFLAEAQAISTQFVIGFQANDDPTYDIIPAPGWENNVNEVDVAYSVVSDPDIDSDTLLGPVVIYQLVYNQTPTGYWKDIAYTDCPVGIRAVQFYWARGPIVQDSIAPSYIPAESITVRQSFNLNALTITSSAELEINNWDGSMGTYSQNNGQNATQIAIGRYPSLNDFTDSFAPLNFGQANQVVFTGIGHNQGEINVRANTFRYVCADRTLQLLSPRWALPWMDGWNSLYAIAYLAQLGGVMLEQLFFASYVPDDPYEDWGDPSNSIFGLGAYFLPVGYFSTQLTRFSGQGLWDMMSAIAQSIGYLLYFDIFGYLHFEKFMLPFMLEYGEYFPPVRAFYESDAQSAYYGDGGDPNTGFTGCWDISWRKDMNNVRNKVIIVGINAFQPAWQPIVVAETDTDSIDTATALNFLGYNNPYVNAGNQFADPAFAYLACNEILGIFRVPEAKISLTTWFQPDIYPLNVINVFGAHIGTIGPYAQPGSESFLVTEVTHSLSQRTQVGSTTISGLAMGQFGNTYSDNGNTG